MLICCVAAHWGKPGVMRSPPSGSRCLHPADGVSSQILSQHSKGCCVPYQMSVTGIQQAIISCVGLEVSGPCSQLFLFSQNFRTGKVPQTCMRRHSSVHQPLHTKHCLFYASALVFYVEAAVWACRKTELYGYLGQYPLHLHALLVTMHAISCLSDV